MKKVVKYLKEVRRELKKVHWPTKEEVIKFSTVVIFITLIVSLYIGGLDFVFAKIIEVLIR